MAAMTIAAGQASRGATRAPHRRSARGSTDAAHAVHATKRTRHTGFDFRFFSTSDLERHAMTDQQAQTSTARKPFHRLLLTGAAGNLGAQLRGALGAWADFVRVSDIAPLSASASHEEAVSVDLADRAA